MLFFYHFSSNFVHKTWACVHTQCLIHTNLDYRHESLDGKRSFFQLVLITSLSWNRFRRFELINASGSGLAKNFFHTFFNHCRFWFKNRFALKTYWTTGRPVGTAGFGRKVLTVRRLKMMLTLHCRAWKVKISVQTDCIPKLLGPGTDNNSTQSHEPEESDFIHLLEVQNFYCWPLQTSLFWHRFLVEELRVGDVEEQQSHNCIMNPVQSKWQNKWWKESRMAFSASKVQTQTKRVDSKK